MMLKKSLFAFISFAFTLSLIFAHQLCLAQKLSTTAPWPMFQHDQKHTGKTRFVGTHVGALRWRFKTDGPIVSSPTIAEDGTIYVGSDDNYVYAINRDGSLKWRYKTGGIVRSSPAISEDGTVYIGSFDKKLYAFDGSNGNVKWTYQTGDGIESSPAIDESGTIYIGSSDGYLYAIDENGNLLWKSFISGPLGSSPAIGDDGTIYIGCWLGNLFALNQFDGSIIWQYPTYTGGVYSSPTITGDGSIYIANDQVWKDEISKLPEPYNEPWYIHRVNSSGTSEIMKNFGDADVYSTIAVEANTSFFVGYGNSLLAANPDGELKWAYPTKGKVDASPVIGGDGIVYVGSDDGFFYAIDPNCACSIWKYQTGGCIRSSAAIDNDSYRTIYVGSQDGYLYAFFDGYKIAGQVTCNGAGLSGVTMTLTSDYLEVPKVTLTDAQGKYDFSGLDSPIKYTVAPSRAGYFFVPAFREVTIQETSEENINFTAVMGFNLSGQIKFEDGTGLEGVTVVLASNTSVSTQTDSQGYYSFEKVIPGTYTLTPTKQGYGFIPPSQTVTVSDSDISGIDFTAIAGYSISGQITSNDNGISGVTMTLSGQISKTTETDSEGRYIFTGLQNGAYTITPSKNGYQFSPPSQTVTIEDSNLENINFTAIYGYSISGIVTLSGTGLSSVTMTLTGTTSKITTTNYDGTYLFSSLENGTYVITPSKEGYSFSPASQVVTISNANEEGIDFIASLGFSISGQVTCNGAGLGGVTMTLSGEAEDTVTTDFSGNYSFIGVGSGSYTVTPSKSGYKFDPEFQDVTIFESNETGIDFTAERVPLPTIFFIAPKNGKEGELLNIIGKNFGNEQCPECRVNVGTNTAKVKLWSDWKILAIVPKGNGIALVSVTTNEGTSNEKKFYYIK